MPADAHTASTEGGLAEEAPRRPHRTLRRAWRVRPSPAHLRSNPILNPRLCVQSALDLRGTGISEEPTKGLKVLSGSSLSRSLAPGDPL